ncbi:MAG: delta-aminolevulinic acid dehydratase [Chlorobiales bacterium]|nr:delta-aminolevulinic acid dehydratase [Chlorobiales bacterium]
MKEKNQVVVLSQDAITKSEVRFNVFADALNRVQTYILNQNYKGYDPYDALTSPIFKLPFLNENKILRFGAQQILKRLPINIRPLLGIPKGYNPVTLALCLQGYTHLAIAFPEKRDDYLKKTQFCIDELIRLRSKGYSGACWGYDFDWEARYAKIPAFTPTIVATGFVTNALFHAYEKLGIKQAFDLCKSSCDFVLSDLNRTEAADGTFCWSYSPLDKQVVLNATMKGARLLSQVYSVTGDSKLKDIARQTVRFVIAKQREDGAWSYSIGDTRTWADNFHTGYILDALQAYEQFCEDRDFHNALIIGWNYYSTNFFLEDRIPKYYDNKMYPLDSTAIAQSILTLCHFGDTKTAVSVATWAIDVMQRSDGAFKYQKLKYYENSISYMRWSSAWMFCALSELIYSLKTNK